MAKKKITPSEAPRADQPPPLVGLPPDQRPMAQVQADLIKLLQQQNFASIDEANQFMADLMKSTGGRVPEMVAETDLEIAQRLIYEAFETPSRTKRIKLAREALNVSADCADAYVLLAQDNTETLAEAIALLEAGVKAGERALGKEAFKELKGHFWGFHETRPYMRARLDLAQALRLIGREDEATAHLNDLLRLNPNDNQGARYLLANLLLLQEQHDALAKLLKKFKDDWSATWKYTQALLTFRLEGASPSAERQLLQAFEHNAHVVDYLVGKKPLPKTPPSYVSPGQDDEAVDYALDGILVWRMTPGALDWLKAVHAKTPPKP